MTTVELARPIAPAALLPVGEDALHSSGVGRPRWPLASSLSWVASGQRSYLSAA